VEIVAQDLNNPIDKKTKIWIFLMRIGELSCHQIYERSFTFRGYQFPVCARCTGIFIGHIIAIFSCIMGVRISLIISVLLILITAGDGFLQLFKIKESTNVRRLITGILAGIGFIFILVNIASYFSKHLY
jgi:uncharacterized membrane protein